MTIHPFYNNRADIGVTVIIDGKSTNLPVINEDDFPHWDDTNGTFAVPVSGDSIPISIQVCEYDDGTCVGGETDVVDINPAPDKDDLDFVLDLCSLALWGDGFIEEPIQGFIEVSGGSEDFDATIKFEVKLEDMRPASSEDLLW